MRTPKPRRPSPPEQSLKSSLQKSLSGAQRIAVLAVGSSLRADDAAGLLAAQELSSLLDKPRKHPTELPAVEIFLGETAPENLTGPIKAFRPTHLIILDALDTGREPGHVCLLHPDEIAAGGTASTHNASLRLLMDYLGQDLSCQILVIGIQPQTLEFGKPPSEPVLQAAHRIARRMAAALSISR